MSRWTVPVLTAFVLAPGCTPPPSPAQANKEVVRRFVEAINRRDFDALDDLVAPDVRRHSPSTPGVTVENLDDFKAFLRQDLRGVPDAVRLTAASTGG